MAVTTRSIMRRTTRAQSKKHSQNILLSLPSKRPKARRPSCQPRKLQTPTTPRKLYRHSTCLPSPKTPRYSLPSVPSNNKGSSPDTSPFSLGSPMLSSSPKVLSDTVSDYSYTQGPLPQFCLHSRLNVSCAA